MYRIVTNNRLCLEKYGNQIDVELLENGSFLDVLYKVRNYVQGGWRLETHPMTGSLKPNQTPYKSVMISDRNTDREEFYQQEITMENAVDTCLKFQRIRQTPDWPEHLRDDYRLVDLSLIEGAIQKIL